MTKSERNSPRGKRALGKVAGLEVAGQGVWTLDWRMQHALFAETGRPDEVVTVCDTPESPLIPGEVRLRMLAAPVNPADLNFIEGTYGRKPVLPAVPGIEGVGVVTECGPGVSGWTPGQMALPLAGAGCWSATLTLPAEKLLPLPDGLDPLQAAMLRVNPATAWGLLHAAGTLPPGSWVVQNAASSAAGHCVMGLAKVLGLRTLNFVRREASIPACQAAGGDVVLVDHADAGPAARGVLGDAPVALALNAVGGDSALRLMDLLTTGGTLVTYGAMGRQALKVPNGFLIFKDVRLHGFWLTRWLETLPAAEVAALYQRLAGMVRTGALRQPVAAVYPLADITAALVHAAGAGRGGKVLLTLS